MRLSLENCFLRHLGLLLLCLLLGQRDERGVRWLTGLLLIQVPDQHLLHVCILELFLPQDQLLALVGFRSGARLVHLSFRLSGDILHRLVFPRVLLMMNFD